MKRLSVILFVLSPTVFLVGVWVSPVFWQCLVTALVVLFAGAALASAANAKHHAAMDRAKSIAGLSDPGIIYRETPYRPTKTQAQVDAELARMTKHEGGHQ